MFFLRYMLVWVISSIIVLPLHAQNLIDRYTKARFNTQVHEFFEEHGLKARPESVKNLPTRADTIQHWLNQIASNARISSWKTNQKDFEIADWKLVRKFERDWFNRKFDNTLWAFLGTEPLQQLDTTYTRELRSMLEAYYGPPTQTISELYGNTGASRVADRYIQFEYWFVVNDSIPVVLMDVNGPLERGLIVSSDQQYRDILLQVRESLLKEFVHSEKRAPYVDYYFDAILRNWYYVGFDGRSYFHESIGQPNLALGRPWLDIQHRID